MTNYLDILADTIRNNWNQPALTDFYLTEDGKSQDTSRGNQYTYGQLYDIEITDTPLQKTEKQTIKRYLYH